MRRSGHEDIRLSAFLALRYLSASRRKAHVALISAISVAGLAVGVAALVISIALLSGFQDRIRSQMADRGPHLAVSPERGDRLADSDSVRGTLEGLEGVRAVEPVFEGRGWLADESGTHTTPVRWRNAVRGTFAGERVGGLPVVRLSRSAAGRTGTSVGSAVRLTSQRTRLSPIGPIPISISLRVVALGAAGPVEPEPDVLVTEAAAVALSGSARAVRALEAKLADPQRAEKTARAAAAMLGEGYRVETWRERNAALSFALRLEKVVIFATVFLIIVVAGLNVVSNVALLVVEKKRDLGVLSSLGASSETLSRVYLFLGGAIGSIGTVAGLLLGALASWVLDRFELVPLPGDVYLLSHVPFALHPGEVSLIAAFALGTSLAAALIPARAAARIAPREAVRLSR